MTAYYVCSHGSSYKYPVVVGEKDAEMLKLSGVRVYTREEYLRIARIYRV